MIGTDRGGVVARGPDEIAPVDARRFEEAVTRREAREPFQYVVGEAEFRGRAFEVDRRVLVPRPETEQVVEAALASGLRPGDRVADLGTGSGCIAISLALDGPGLVVHAIDASREALEVARRNAERLGAAGRVRFALGDLGSSDLFPPASLDAIVSNPPYVSEEEWRGLEPEVRDHEPREALVPGPTGLEAYAAIAPAAARILAPGGRLVLELGYRSRDGALAALVDAGLEIVAVENDPRGIPRVVVARRGEEEAG